MYTLNEIAQLQSDHQNKTAKLLNRQGSERSILNRTNSSVNRNESIQEHSHQSDDLNSLEDSMN